ncbi:hypothetical protein HPB50_011422 [Hyalomma asiaticum]|uniref:Uncharacterized protein n=1 Tax=Hyalomma asiaticum TaxID=266040 RepID=A0ACB7S623_HYAAI|nr:hypothetical protein HPB50_011422 [Hyalomma asiaticum]
MSTLERGEVARRSHRRLFRELTVRSGDFDLRPTATAWWLKDVTLLAIVASCALTWEGQRYEELAVGAVDVGFRGAAGLVSTVLLGSLVCPRPALFRRCFWAHAVCLPGDISLSAAFVVLKAEEMFNSDYARLKRSTPRNSPAKAGVVPYVAGTRTGDSSRLDDAARLHESRRTAAADKNSSSRRPQIYGRTATPYLKPRATSWKRNESDGRDTLLTSELRVMKATAINNSARCNSSLNIDAVQQDSLTGEELAEENRLRKAAAARHQLAVFTLADHIICIFARAYLLMRMRACLAALASDEVDERNADGTPLQDEPETLSPSVVKMRHEVRGQGL